MGKRPFEIQESPYVAASAARSDRLDRKRPQGPAKASNRPAPWPAFSTYRTVE
jgi:hypothetical protein